MPRERENIDSNFAKKTMLETLFKAYMRRRYFLGPKFKQPPSSSSSFHEVERRFRKLSLFLS